MMIEVLKSKHHCVTVTEANLNYMGSITIDEDLMDAAGMIAGEKVQIVDNNNGERFETYIIKGERGSGCICLNGAAARKVQVGDVCILISYALMDFEEAKTFTPRVVFPESNRDPNKNYPCTIRYRKGHVAALLEVRPRFFVPKSRNKFFGMALYSIMHRGNFFG